MGFKSRKNKSKSRKLTKRIRRRLTKRIRKRRTLKGGMFQEARRLVLPLQNLRFEHNKNKFKKKYKKRDRDGSLENLLPINISEHDIDIIGPDYNPVEDYMVPPDGIRLLQRIIDWKTANPGQIPPWQEYVGKLCEVPEDFFIEYVSNLPRNLETVKKEYCNVVFPQAPDNSNITPIEFKILGYANEEGKTVDSNNELIVPGKYKFIILSNNEVRYIPDTGNYNPHYYFPAVMLYFFNVGWISFRNLKDSLDNEIPHSVLFDARREDILGGGDFIVNADEYVTNLSGYSGHTKPLPSNVIYSAHIFISMGYPLIYKKINEPIQLQTESTDRDDDGNNRLFGTYYKIEYERTIEEEEEDI